MRCYRDGKLQRVDAVMKSQWLCRKSRPTPISSEERNMPGFLEPIRTGARLLFLLLSWVAIESSGQAFTDPFPTMEALQAEHPQPEMATLRIYTAARQAKGDCDTKFEITGASSATETSYVPKGSYHEFEVWPGRNQLRHVFRRGSRCGLVGQRMNLNVAPGGVYHVSFNWRLLSTRFEFELHEGEEALRKFRNYTLAGRSSFEESRPARTLAGGSYLGPKPQSQRPVWGRISYSDRTYFGPVLDGIGPLPEGVTYYRDGRMFRGEYRSGEPSNGQLKLADGGSFIGDLSQGLPARGATTFISGTAFSGTHVNGLPQGEGVCSDPESGVSACTFESGRDITRTPMQLAQAQLDAQVASELAQARAAAAQLIRERESRVAALRAARSEAPGRILTNRSEMQKRCQCYVSVSEGHTPFCLSASDPNDSPEQRAAKDQAKAATRSACIDWANNGRGANDEARLASRLKEIDEQLAAENESIARARAQADQRLAALAAEQAATRQARLERLRAAAEQRKGAIEAKDRQQCAAARDSGGVVTCHCAYVLAGRARTVGDTCPR